MTKTIYIVTAGKYSDYHICAAFSTNKKAKEYTVKMTDYLALTTEHYSIKKMEVDVKIIDHQIIQVHMDKEGNTESLLRMDNTYNSVGFQTYDYGHNLVWNVNTDNEQTAVKVVNEKRIQILAQDNIEKRPLWNNETKTRMFFNMKLRNK